MKEIIIKDSPGFQLRLKKWECQAPKGLYALNFIQASKDREGKIDQESTYEFFMTNEEIKTLAETLLNE